MISRFAEGLRPFEQLVIVDIENARSHFGALQHATGLDKMPAFVARQRGVAYAVEAMPAALYHVAETRRLSSSSRIFVTRW